MEDFIYKYAGNGMFDKIELEDAFDEYEKYEYLPYYERHADKVKTKYREYFVCCEENKINTKIHHLLCWNEPTDANCESIEVETISLDIGFGMGFRFYVIAENWERAIELVRPELEKLYPRYREYINKSRHHWKNFAWICKQNNKDRSGRIYNLPV